MPVTDTTSDAAALQLQHYRSLSASERVQIAVDLSDAVRATTMAGIRRRHPAYSEEEVGHEFVAIVYGDSIR